MKLLPAPQTSAARCTVAIGFMLFLATNGSLVAQTTGSTDPRLDVDPSEKADAPPAGGCMPIGVTASGEVVFPLQCRDFIERQKAADRKAADSAQEHNSGSAEPAVRQEPVVTEEKTAANKEETSAPENGKPVEGQVAKAPLGNRIEREPRVRSAGPPGCTRFRSYDPASETYRSYDGRRLSCRGADRAAMVK
jgi:BA14K-like protein